MAGERIRVLFVCIGNICRSPTAEVVFRDRAKRAGYAHRIEVDSAGMIEWHAGNPPDYRAIAHAARRGYDLAPLRARQVLAADFARFDLILAMEQAVLRDLRAMRPARFDGVLAGYLDFTPGLEGRDVPDPYDSGPEAFEEMLDLIEKGCEGLVGSLLARRAAGSHEGKRD